MRLGDSIPENEVHAISVSLPLWKNIIDYEEGDKSVIGQLKCGYPRFFIHPLVLKLNESVGGFVLPNENAALRCRDFLKEFEVEMIKVKSAVGVVIPETAMSKMKLYWQHTGDIVSSRYAAYLLSNRLMEEEDGSWYGRLCSRVGEVMGAEKATCFPTGMSAFFATFRAVVKRKPTGKTVMFGFPYIDSLKILQRKEWNPNGNCFYPKASEEDYEHLEDLLAKGTEVAGIFTEFPSNPLLQCVDLKRLKALADKYDAVLVVDDTIASFNTNVLEHDVADVVVTSLSKLFSGNCKVMGGSVVVNWRNEKINVQEEGYIYHEDAQVLIEASMDLEDRRNGVNENAAHIVKQLQVHDSIQTVYYPQSEDAQRYMTYMDSRWKNKPGFGPMFSFVIKGGEQAASAFYDAFQVAKGPSLGTNFTLCCPYTLLAHYGELEFVESCGIDRNLIRCSIGLESAKEIWKRFLSALNVLP